MGWNHKVRGLGEKIIPLAILGTVAFGGWHLYKTGTFRRGIKPAITNAVSHIPYFGSRFRHYIGPSKRNSSVVSKGKHYKRGKKRHQSRKKHTRRRNRRHR